MVKANFALFFVRRSKKTMMVTSLDNGFVFHVLLAAVAGLLITREASSATTGCPRDLPNTTEMKRFGDLCYQFVSEEKYWYDARRYCLQNGGRLVKIGDSETNAFIVRTLNGLWWRNNGVWIGLHDTYREMQFQWTGYRIYENEAAGPWTNWGRGHPGAILHSLRDCVRMVRKDGSWKWHETPCNSLQWHYRFICEYKARVYRPGVQLTLREDRPMADNKMQETSTRSPSSTVTAPAKSPPSSPVQTTVVPTEEQTSEIGLFESTRNRFDDGLNFTDKESHQALTSFTTPGVDNDESTSFRSEFTKEELAVADWISFEEEEESETLDDTKGSGVCTAISLGFVLVATGAILLAVCIIYRRRQQRQVITSFAGNDKDDKESKMAERNPSSGPSRAVANIYVVTVPRPSSDVPDVEPVSATWVDNHLPTFDDEAPAFGLRLQANRSTDGCDEEAAEYDCPVADVNELYAEIADDDDDKETKEAVEHIYESLNDYSTA